jgi:hypothetical protein
MKTKPGARTGWVWTALVLQGVIFLLRGQSVARLIAEWGEYAARGVDMLPLVLRSTVGAGRVGASLIGLWRGRRWGWFLGVLANGAICAQVLWSLLEVGVAVVRSPVFLALSALGFAAFVVLLHDPVRKYFLGSGRGGALTRAPRSSTGPDEPIKPLRVLVYFVVAVMTACIATAFTVTLLVACVRTPRKRSFWRSSQLGVLWAGVPVADLVVHSAPGSRHRAGLFCDVSLGFLATSVNYSSYSGLTSERSIRTDL